MKQPTYTLAALRQRRCGSPHRAGTSTAADRWWWDGRREVRTMEREQITIRLPVELKADLQQEADRRGITLHDLITFIFWKEKLCTVPK